MTTLSDFIRPRSRFSRSANVERDHGSRAIAGYIPTGRAIDVVSRLARGLSDPAAGRTFSITGPHGGGKSSLAVFLDGLLAKQRSTDYVNSHGLLRTADEHVEGELTKGIIAVGGERHGFVRAFATAKSEPVSSTIARALYGGAIREFGKNQTVVPQSFGRPGTDERVASNDIHRCIREICARRPLILLIDEFGKNLEFYGTSNNLGDPFLLQELAEATQGEAALPLVILTMQHLSFDEYVHQASTTRRREWSKVQGRFQDIPYIETPVQARRLIAASLERTSKAIDTAAAHWIEDHQDNLASLGLRDIAEDARAAIPLHPLTLAVLPELCSRYGQNERTLFSFLAGSEPLAVPQFLAASIWSASQPLLLLGLDRVYDYFLESSGNMIGVAEGASRWMEIETRIRDTAGLTSAQLRTIKGIGVLNLVSNGGRVRASRSMIEFALLTGEDGTQTATEIDSVLSSLIDAGLIVYRAFSDEYRVWQGSDYDLKRVIDGARRECADKDLALLLNDAVPLEPVVAGRHSQRNGILRIFAQKFSSLEEEDFDVSDHTWDGLVLYATTEKVLSLQSETFAYKPVVVIRPKDLTPVREAAIETAALQLALRLAEDEDADWVARRELVERTAAAQQKLQSLIGRAWSSEARWDLIENETALNPDSGLSAVLSKSCDLVYTETPRVANEMIARRELTSQGAKARRVLMEAMLTDATRESFALEGYGPEKAIYEAIYRATGIHRPNADGFWELSPPSDRRWNKVWRVIDAGLTGATERTNLKHVIATLTAPPIGLKDSIIPLLLVTDLVIRKDEIALYEHGSLVLSIDDAIAERLTRNPGHFTVKNMGTRTGRRRLVIEALVDRLGISASAARPTFLNVATALFRELRVLPPYTQKTKRSLSAHAIEVRDAFRMAAEPDVLVFETLPEILGIRPFGINSRFDQERAEGFANVVAEILLELRHSYAVLLEGIQANLADATSTSGTLSEIRQRLAGQALNLDGRVLEPRLKSFVGALARSSLDDRAWLENVAMVVSEGHAPRVWTDDIAIRFPLLIEEVGGAMRRTQALLYGRLAANDDQASFSTSRMTLTRPDGSEITELLAITERQIESIDAYFEPLLAELTSIWGSRSEACRMLLARLAAENDQRNVAAKPSGNSEEVRYG
jgi:energy-coupling factor transporter ATP-binding protein EcfA2